MKHIGKRIICAILAIIMVVSMAPNGVFKTAAAKAQSTYETGYIFSFGSYPQTQVTDNILISDLNSQTLQSDNTVTYNYSKYKRVLFTTETNSYQTSNGYNTNTVYWFKFEPLQWRVLSNTNDELLVIADKILDSKAYNDIDAGVTWETCTIRNWLNNDFYNTAFNPTEQAWIITSTVVNSNNPVNGTVGGNNTSDKLFLLSFSEVTNTAYDFITDTSRRAQGTDFSKSNGLYINSGNSYWWLRSPGGSPSSAGFVHSAGGVYYNIGSVSNTFIGARPAFKINLSSIILTSSENSGCVFDYNKMTICGLSAGATSLDGYVNVASGYSLSCVQTQNGFGTGTIANVKKDGEIIQSYTIVIYGDVNGDGNIDSIDSSIIVDVENNAILWETTTDAAYLEAGDLNDDGNIDSMDAGIAVDIENYILFVNQSSGVISVITAIAGSVVIKGLPKYGNILTADATNITPTGATLTYMWKRSGEVVGTDKTYQITTEDIGKSITVTVTGFGAYSGGVRSSAVVATDAILSGTVTITGLAKFGEKLTANTSNIDPAAATVTYQWKRGGVDIGSESTYTITVEDIGQPITITVTGTGIYMGSITSAVVIPTKLNIAAPIAPTLQSVTTNSVTLNAVAGQEYKINSGAWQSSAEFTGLHVNTTYRFYARVAETATHNASTSSTALSVTTNKEELTGAVAITGNPKVGFTLSVDSSGVLPSGATLSYVWKSGTLQIGTNSTYTVLDADIGESITVTVTGTGGYMGSLTSAAVVIVE